MSPSLSVCMMTGGPGPRVAAILALVRPFASQIVVALDDRADLETEAALCGVADVVVRYPYHEYNRTLPWLFSLCDGDWILSLDGDEIPSVALVDELPSLIAATDVTHYWLLRKWLWPDAGTAIAEHPWSTDYQLRLVENDSRLLLFPSETHRPISMLGPHRFVRSPLYHADTILSSLEHRVEKAREYEILRPGKRVGGGPLNHIFYLPERREGLQTEPLPDVDAPTVQAILNATGEPGPSRTTATYATDVQVDRFWAGRPLSDNDRRASLEWLDKPERMTTREHRTFDVRIENLGGTTWPWGDDAEPGVRLAYQWLTEGGEVVVWGVWTTLPADLAPGETQLVPLHLHGPLTRGRYRLRVDLIQEYVGWFGNPIECDVEVSDRRRVALSGDEEAVAVALLELTEDAPQFEPLILSSEPAPRFGPPQSPDLRKFLLADIPSARLGGFSLLTRRTRILFRVAKRMKAGLPFRPMIRDAQTFLDEIDACSHLILVGATERFGTRELWLQFAMVKVAREFGVEVLIQRDATARPHRLLDRILLWQIVRRGRVVNAGTLGLE